MKKLTILFLISVLMLGLLGNVAFAAENSAEGESLKLHFAHKSLTYYFFVVQQAAARRAAESRGWEFSATNASFDNSAQYDQLETAALSGSDIIITDPIDSEGIISAIETAKENGTAVGVVDTPTMGGNVDVTVAFDNYRGGYMAGQRVAELLKEKHGEVKGTVLNAYGALESYAWRLRKQGFDAAMRQYPNIKYLERPSDGLAEKMYDVTMNTLAEYPDLDAVHAPSESPARGIINALKEKDKLHPVGHPDHVIFVGIDGDKIALDWIKDGYMDATVSQDPIAYSEIAIDLIEKYTLQGKPVPTGITYENDRYYFEEASISQGMPGPQVVIPPYYIDGSNVDDPRHWGNRAYNKWNIPFE